MPNRFPMFTSLLHNCNFSRQICNNKKTTHDRKSGKHRSNCKISCSLAKTSSRAATLFPKGGGGDREINRMIHQILRMIWALAMTRVHPGEGLEAEQLLLHANNVYGKSWQFLEPIWRFATEEPRICVEMRCFYWWKLIFIGLHPRTVKMSQTMLAFIFHIIPSVPPPYLHPPSCTSLFPAVGRCILHTHRRSFMERCSFFSRSPDAGPHFAVRIYGVHAEKQTINQLYRYAHRSITFKIFQSMHILLWPA